MSSKYNLSKLSVLDPAGPAAIAGGRRLLPTTVSGIRIWGPKILNFCQQQRHNKLNRVSESYWSTGQVAET